MYWARAATNSQPEMLQQLLPAAVECFGDAQAILVGGSPTGSVYLAGYCVEMVLKHAALRTEGLNPYAYVRDALAPARGRLAAWLGPVEHEGFHSLEFWSLLLRETFRRRKGSVPQVVATAAARAARLHQGWRVPLRYQAKMISAADAAAFLRDVGWFNANALELWR